MILGHEERKQIAEDYLESAESAVMKHQTGSKLSSSEEDLNKSFMESKPCPSIAAQPWLLRLAKEGELSEDVHGSTCYQTKEINLQRCTKGKLAGSVLAHELGHARVIPKTDRSRYPLKYPRPFTLFTGVPPMTFMHDELAASYYALSFRPDDKTQKKHIRRLKKDARDKGGFSSEEIAEIDYDARQLAGYTGEEIK